MLAVCLTDAFPFFSPVSVSQRPLVPELADTIACSCRGTRNTTDARYICGDDRLGPVHLPRKFPLLSVVSKYDRLAGFSPSCFLEIWTKRDGSGTWDFPPEYGFLLDSDGKPILSDAVLQVGTRLDRFGDAEGSYLAAADAPFNQRSLPPSSLNENPKFPDWPYNYHVYEVIKVWTRPVISETLLTQMKANEGTCWFDCPVVRTTWTRGSVLDREFGQHPVLDQQRLYQGG